MQLQIRIFFVYFLYFAEKSNFGIVQNCLERVFEFMRVNSHTTLLKCLSLLNVFSTPGYHVFYSSSNFIETLAKPYLVNVELESGLQRSSLFDWCLTELTQWL